MSPLKQPRVLQAPAVTVASGRQLQLPRDWERCRHPDTGGSSLPALEGAVADGDAVRMQTGMESRQCPGRSEAGQRPVSSET